MKFEIDLSKIDDNELQDLSGWFTRCEDEFFDDPAELSELFEYLGAGVREEIINRQLGLASARPAQFDKLDFIFLSPGQRLAMENLARKYSDRHPEFTTALGLWLEIW